MVNMIIYLKKEHNPNLLIEKLFEEELIGKASIDVDNVAYIKKDHKVEKVINSVITIQTKAVLFTEITTLIEKEFGEDVLITSIPIVGSNVSFDKIIRENTKTKHHQN